MGDEKHGKTLAFSSGKITSTVVPRKSTGDWMCRRLMGWLREIGLEIVHIVVKSDNEPELMSSIEPWIMMRATRSGSVIIIENRLVGSLKSNSIDERAIQTVQGMIRTIRSAIEETWKVKIGVSHSVWLWIAEKQDSC